jgi:hypothetical protein
MRLIRRPVGRGQALVEFALVFPLFLLVLVSIISFGLYIFYNQQLANAAREAIRYAAVHSSTAQCPTVSRINPILTNQAQSYFRCDTPEAGWPRMTAAARKNIWGMAPNQVSLTACWSGYTDSASPPNADVIPTTPGATFTDCTIQGIDPQANPGGLPCPAPVTNGSAFDINAGKADGDDKASSLSFANDIHYPTTVTVYTCFNWTPPMAGFVIIPQTITLRAVLTEVLQRQQ